MTRLADIQEAGQYTHPLRQWVTQLGGGPPRLVLIHGSHKNQLNISQLNEIKSEWRRFKTGNGTFLENLMTEKAIKKKEF